MSFNLCSMFFANALIPFYSQIRVYILVASHVSSGRPNGVVRWRRIVQTIREVNKNNLISCNSLSLFVCLVSESCECPTPRQTGRGQMWCTDCTCLHLKCGTTYVSEPRRSRTLWSSLPQARVIRGQRFHCSVYEGVYVCVSVFNVECVGVVALYEALLCMHVWCACACNSHLSNQIANLWSSDS